jgi:hypothetical protein
MNTVVSQLPSIRISPRIHTFWSASVIDIGTAHPYIHIERATEKVYGKCRAEK